MTAQQGGNGYKPSTVYAEIRISAYCRSKTESASFAKEVLTKFVPAEILPWITITERDVYGDSSVIHVTIDYSAT